MVEKPVYYDIRSRFWRDHFEEALGYEAFLADTAPGCAAKWKAAEEVLPAFTEEQKQRLVGHNRRVHLLAYCAAWCGDCSRQMPMLEAIADVVGPEMKIRYMDRDDAEDLKDELRILGAMRVPVVVFLSEDFFEVGRVGDRLLTAYRRKRAQETGEACDTGLLLPPEESLAAEQAEWVDICERMLIMLRLSPPLRDRYED